MGKLDLLVTVYIVTPVSYCLYMGKLDLLVTVYIVTPVSYCLYG